MTQKTSLLPFITVSVVVAVGAVGLFRGSPPAFAQVKSPVPSLPPGAEVVKRIPGTATASKVIREIVPSESSEPNQLVIRVLIENADGTQETVAREDLAVAASGPCLAKLCVKQSGLDQSDGEAVVAKLYDPDRILIRYPNGQEGFIAKDDFGVPLPSARGIKIGGRIGTPSGRGTLLAAYSNGRVKVRLGSGKDRSIGFFDAVDVGPKVTIAHCLKVEKICLNETVLDSTDQLVEIKRFMERTHTAIVKLPSGSETMMDGRRLGKSQDKLFGHEVGEQVVGPDGPGVIQKMYSMGPLGLPTSGARVLVKLRNETQKYYDLGEVKVRGAE